MTDITVIILTKDEEHNIGRCIDSVKMLAKRVVVLDSYSNDSTIDIAKDKGAEVFQHEFIHYGAQFQYALDNCSITTKWVFRLDADEEVSAESRREIEELCEANNNTDINGFVFRLQTEFMGKSIKHGVLNILEKLCIFKFGKAYMENRYLGEHLILTEGKSVKMKSLSYHHEVRSLSFMMNKFNWYSDREVKDYFVQKNNIQEIANLDKTTRLRRFVKFKIYYRLPSRLRCQLVFFYWYFLHFGFLDGKEGFYWNFFQTYYYRTLVDAKIREVELTGNEIGETGAWSCTMEKDKSLKSVQK